MPSVVQNLMNEKNFCLQIENLDIEENADKTELKTVLEDER